jgi:hypothetical protein
MGVATFMPRPLYSQQKNLVPTEYEDGWVPELVWTVSEKKQYFSPCRNSNPRSKYQLHITTKYNELFVQKSKHKSNTLTSGMYTQPELREDIYVIKPTVENIS